MDLTDYVKIERAKMLLVKQIESLGLKEQLQVINNVDVEKIVYILFSLGDALRDMSDREKVEHLLTYIVGLLTKLVVDHGANIEDL